MLDLSSALLSDVDLEREARLFLRAAEAQKEVAEQSPHWAKIYASGACEGGGAYCVTDASQLKAKSLIGRVRISRAHLHSLVADVLSGLCDLKRIAGRPHGNLKPSNILLTGSGSGARALLTDPSADARVTGHSSSAPDLRALGELVFELVTRRPFDNYIPWPLPPASEWRSLGRGSDRWREFCSFLLDPNPPAALRQLEEVQRRLAELQPRRWTPIVASAAALVAVAGATAGIALTSGWFGDDDERGSPVVAISPPVPREPLVRQGDGVERTAAIEDPRPQARGSLLEDPQFKPHVDALLGAGAGSAAVKLRLPEDPAKFARAELQRLDAPATREAFAKRLAELRALWSSIDSLAQETIDWNAFDADRASRTIAPRDNAQWIAALPEYVKPPEPDPRDAIVAMSDVSAKLELLRTLAPRHELLGANESAEVNWSKLTSARRLPWIRRNEQSILKDVEAASQALEQAAKAETEKWKARFTAEVVPGEVDHPANERWAKHFRGRVSQVTATDLLKSRNELEREWERLRRIAERYAADAVPGADKPLDALAREVARKAIAVRNDYVRAEIDEKPLDPGHYRKYRDWLGRWGEAYARLSAINRLLGPEYSLDRDVLSRRESGGKTVAEMFAEVMDSKLLGDGDGEAIAGLRSRVELLQKIDTAESSAVLLSIVSTGEQVNEAKLADEAVVMALAWRLGEIQPMPSDLQLGMILRQHAGKQDDDKGRRLAAEVERTFYDRLEACARADGGKYLEAVLQFAAENKDVLELEQERLSWLEFNLFLRSLKRHPALDDGAARKNLAELKRVAKACGFDYEARVDAVLSGRSSMAPGPRATEQWFERPIGAALMYTMKGRDSSPLRLAFLPVGEAYVSTTEVSLDLFQEIVGTGKNAQAYFPLLPKDPPKPHVWARVAGADRLVANTHWVEHIELKVPVTRAPMAMAKLPVQSITPEAAALAAQQMGCRLPRREEWQVALAAYLQRQRESGRPHAWKLRDRAWDDQVQHMRGLRNMAEWLDRGVFGVHGHEHPNMLKFKEAPAWSAAALPKDALVSAMTEAQRNDYQHLNDESALFRPVNEGSHQDFQDLVGNVAEFVTEGADVRVIGGSALSPPELGYDRAHPLPKGAGMHAYSDVGFRLAFDARPLSLVESYRRFIDGFAFVPPPDEAGAH